MENVHCIASRNHDTPPNFELKAARRVKNLYNYFRQDSSEETAASLTQATLMLLQIGVTERGRPPP